MYIKYLTKGNWNGTKYRKFINSGAVQSSLGHLVINKNKVYLSYNNAKFDSIQQKKNNTQFLISI